MWLPRPQPHSPQLLQGSPLVGQGFSQASAKTSLSPFSLQRILPTSAFLSQIHLLRPGLSSYSTRKPLDSIWLCLSSLLLLLLLLLLLVAAANFKKKFVLLHQVLVDTCGILGSGFHDQGLNLHPLLWEHRVSATGSPQKSQQCKEPSCQCR